jgi:hypothetical protein
MNAQLLHFPWVTRWNQKGEFRLNRAVVVIAPMHKRVRCPPECEGCFYCEAGIFACTRCGGAEGSLPTDCPGERMSEVIERAVLEGVIDYTLRGGWIRGKL